MRKKNIMFGMVAFVAFMYAATHTSINFIPRVLADDGEESSDSEDSKDQEKDSEKESEKKAEEIKKESEKKAAEIKKESEKKKLEIIRKEREQKLKFESEDEKGKLKVEFKNKNEDVEDENEDGEDENEDVEDEENDASERILKAQEKIAEAEKHILEQQAEGKDVTVALARLAQAKEFLGLVQQSKEQQGDSSDSLIKEALKSAHKAEGDDIRSTEDLYKSAEKAGDRIQQAEEKLAKLTALGGNTGSFQAMIDQAKTDLDQAKQLISQNNLLEGIILAQKAEREAKSAKKAIEAALLELGVDDDDLSGDHKSVVAQAVEQLLSVANIEGENGIGTKVREIAREQRDSAKKIDELVDEAQSRDDFAEFWLGPKYVELDGIQEQINNNQQRIQSLTQIAASLTDEDLKTMVQDQIDALNQENTKLQAFVDGKETQKGIFGWVFRLFR